MARICFLNPFGTDSYDELIDSTLRPALQGATELAAHDVDEAAEILGMLTGRSATEQMAES